MIDDKLRERLLAERIARELARSDGIPDDASTGDYLRNARDLLAAMPELTRNTAELDRLEAENARKSALLDQLAGETEHLRRCLRAARPYISDKAGAGIIGAIDQALATYRESRHEA